MESHRFRGATLLTMVLLCLAEILVLQRLAALVLSEEALSIHAAFVEDMIPPLAIAGLILLVLLEMRASDRWTAGIVCLATGAVALGLEVLVAVDVVRPRSMTLLILILAAGSERLLRSVSLLKLARIQA